MDEAGAVDVVQRPGEPRRQGPDGRLVERPVGAYGVREGRPGQELGGDPRPSALGPGVQDAGHGPAADRLGHARLADEALGEVRVVRQVGVQHLHRGGAPLAVLADVDLAHAPFAEDGEDAVRAQADRVSGFQGLHGV